MFLLFGEKEQAQLAANGEFLCPCCQQSTEFTHHLIENHFTLFNISLAKLNVTSDYVVCHQCQSCFSPLILSAPQDHQQAIDKTSLLRALCYLLSGYGNTSQSRQRAIDIYQRHTNLTITDQDIINELSIVDSGQAPTLPYLKGITLLLSPKAKHDIVIACYQFANGSCMMEHHDRVRINTIASSLEISLPEVEYLINHSA